MTALRWCGPGREVGMRTVRIPHVQSTISLWHLGLDSELVFVGDAGTTEASRPSRRVGIEWATYASPRRWLSLDGDIAVSRATFTDADPAGNRIPGSVQSVISLGASLHEVRRMSGSIRMRFFGPRPLVEDNSVRSSATSLLSAQAGYRVGPHSRVVVELFNLLNERASDIDYFYTSRPSGRAQRGCCRHSHAPGASAQYACDDADHFLVSIAFVQMSISSGVIVPSGTSRAST